MTQKGGPTRRSRPGSLTSPADDVTGPADDDTGSADDDTVQRGQEMATTDHKSGQSDGLIAQSGGLMAQSDGLMAQSGGLMAQSDGVTGGTSGFTGLADGLLALSEDCTALACGSAETSDNDIRLSVGVLVAAGLSDGGSAACFLIYDFFFVDDFFFLFLDDLFFLDDLLTGAAGALGQAIGEELEAVIVLGIDEIGGGQDPFHSVLNPEVEEAIAVGDGGSSLFDGFLNVIECLDAGEEASGDLELVIAEAEVAQFDAVLGVGGGIDQALQGVLDCFGAGGLHSSADAGGLLGGFADSSETEGFPYAAVELHGPSALGGQGDSG
jgi:hypothetical protein